MSTVAAPTPTAPTLTVARTPSPMVAGQTYTLSWSSTNATSLTRVCSASAPGYSVSDAPAVQGGSVSGTALAAWVDHPSTCTWTAKGAGGSKVVTETMTTIAASTPPAPTLTVARTPSPMIAGQTYTLSWNSANATSLTRVCTASAPGYIVSDAPAVQGGSAPGTALAGWVGHPSTCTWTAKGAGGSKVVTETMTTNVPAPTISANRTPSPMVAGKPFTLTWHSTNATSVTRACTAGGTGYTVSDAPATSVVLHSVCRLSDCSRGSPFGGCRVQLLSK